jgi:DNA polymerase-3 subunit gamma/tau
MNSLYAGDIKVCSSVFRTLLSENVPLKNVVLAILDAAYQAILGRERTEVFKEKGLALEKAASALSRAELFWIYETLAKDFKWTIDSLWPREATELALQKVCLRREFFKTKNSPPVETSSTENSSPTQETSTTPPATISESLEPVAPKAPPGDWKDFIVHLFSKAPALAAALEQGNLLRPIIISEESLLVDIGFTESGRVFREYLNDETARNRLRSALASFFNVGENKVTTNFSVLDEETSTRSNFKSHVELELKDRESAQKKIKTEFLDLPIIREAERLFNTKIDRVILEEGR